MTNIVGWGIRVLLLLATPVYILSLVCIKTFTYLDRVSYDQISHSAKAVAISPAEQRMAS